MDWCKMRKPVENTEWLLGHCLWVPELIHQANVLSCLIFHSIYLQKTNWLRRELMCLLVSHFVGKVSHKRSSESIESFPSCLAKSAASASWETQNRYIWLSESFSFAISQVARTWEASQNEAFPTEVPGGGEPLFGGSRYPILRTPRKLEGAWVLHTEPKESSCWRFLVVPYTLTLPLTKCWTSFWRQTKSTAQSDFLLGVVWNVCLTDHYGMKVEIDDKKIFAST